MGLERTNSESHEGVGVYQSSNSQRLWNIDCLTKGDFSIWRSTRLQLSFPINDISN
jgi:hypothetical protein